MDTWTWKRTAERRDGDEIVIVTFGEHAIGEQAPYFSVTAETYDRHARRHEPRIVRDGRSYWLGGCGCQHDTVRRVFPELAPFLDWHLSFADGPMHYEANALYWADHVAGRVKPSEYDPKDRDYAAIFRERVCLADGETAPDFADRDATAAWLRARLPRLVERRAAAMAAAQAICATTTPRSRRRRGTSSSAASSSRTRRSVRRRSC